MSSWGTICHRAKSDLRDEHKPDFTFFFFFLHFRVHHKGPGFAPAFRTGNSSLCFSQGHFKVAQGFVFFLMSRTIPAPCTVPALAGCCPPQPCSCPCAEGHLRMVLPNPRVSPQHRGQAASRAHNFLMCEREETEGIPQLLLFTATAGTGDSTQVCLL